MKGQGSGTYDGESVDMLPVEGHYSQVACRVGEGSCEHGGDPRGWGLRKQALQNWHRRPYRNSTEGEEGDVSDVGSRTTESEVEVWELENRAAEPLQSRGRKSRHRLGTGRIFPSHVSTGVSARHLTGGRRH